jgi:hypothetical protein
MADQTVTSKLSAVGPDWRSGALQLISIRRPELRQRGNLFITALVLRLAGVVLLAWIGYIHWELWHEGYSTLPTIGPTFLINAIAGLVLAVVLLVWPRPLVGLLAAGFVATTILALVISLSVGLFGFKESIGAPHVVQALVLEGIAVVVLLAWTGLAAGAVPRRT